MNTELTCQFCHALELSTDLEWSEVGTAVLLLCPFCRSNKTRIEERIRTDPRLVYLRELHEVAG